MPPKRPSNGALRVQRLAPSSSVFIHPIYSGRPLGIEWPYGHFFERTEIKSHQQLLQERILQLQYYLQRTLKIVVSEYSSVNVHDLAQQIARILDQVNAGQTTAPSTLQSLEQNLRQLIAQHDMIEVDTDLYVER